MTEEEKKAIEDLKDILKYWQTIVDIEDDIEREIEMNCYSEEMPFKQLKIALNLIEKLQKEKIPTKFYACDPNKYKECKKKHCYINGGECDATIDETKVKYINLEDYIPKDKIREYIKEKEEEKEGVKNISLEEYAITSKELKESEICLLKCILEEK